MLDDFIDARFERIKEKFGREAYNMRFHVYANPKPTTGAQGRAWYVGSLDDNIGWMSLDNKESRLIGEAPAEAALGHLEQRISTALNHGKAFEYNGTLYVPVNTDNLVLKQ